MAINNKQPLGSWRIDPSVSTGSSVSTGQSAKNIFNIAEILSSLPSEKVSRDPIVQEILSILPNEPLEVSRISRILSVDPEILANALHNAAAAGLVRLVKEADGSILASKT